MKKLISILLCLLLLLTAFSGCDKKEPASAPTEKPTELSPEKPADTVVEKLSDQVIYSAETYKIERIDGTCYLSIDGYESEDYKESHGFQIKQYVSFNSYYEFRNALRIDGLSEEQIEQFKKCKRPGEKGRIEIFEVFNLREPKLPLGAKLEEVKWYGDSFDYIIKAGSTQIIISYLTEREYKLGYEQDITNRPDSFVMSGNGVKYDAVLSIYENSSEPYHYSMFFDNNGIFVNIQCFSNIQIAEEWLLQLGY